MSMSAKDCLKLVFMRLSLRFEQTIQNHLVDREKLRQSAGTFLIKISK